MHLVHEQDDVAALADLLHDLLEALLELAAVLAAGDERRKIERVELLAANGLRHLVGGDELRKPLDDGRLAHTRLADEHGVVLGPAREDLHHALDLLLAADHRVELALVRRAREVAAELVEQRRLGAPSAPVLLARLGRLAVVPGEQLDDGRAHLLEIGAEVEQHLRGDALPFADEAEQDVLGADVVVAELEALSERQLKHLLGARRERDMTGGLVGPAPDELLHLQLHVIERDVEALQRAGGDALLLLDEPEEQMLGADVVLVELLGLFLRVDDHAAGLLGEAFEHVRHSYRKRPGTAHRVQHAYSTPRADIAATGTDREASRVPWM